MPGQPADKTFASRRPEIFLTRVALAIALLAQVAANRGLLTVRQPNASLIFDLAFVVAAYACWRRSRTGSQDRGAWLALTFGLMSWTLGEFYAAYILRYAHEYPSPADGFWLLFYIFIYVAIILMAKARVTEFLPSTWLDGVIAGFGAAAIVAALVLAPALSLTDGNLPTVVTNLAYPVADLVMMVLLISVSHTLREHGQSWWLLAAGLALFFIGDVYYLYVVSTSAAESWNKNLLATSWTFGVAMIGFAATLPEHETTKTSHSNVRFFVPGFFAISALGLLMYGQRHHMPTVATVFILITLALSVSRLVLTGREVRELAANRAEARTDYLTKLPNRRHLVEQLGSELAGPGGRAALLVIDLDRFKEINDSLGHIVGDDILTSVGQRLAGSIPTGGMLSRLGGDEFAVLLPGHSPAEASKIADDLHVSLEEPFLVGGFPISVRASVGVAAAPQHGDTVVALMAHADIAMYQAKQAESGVATYQAQQDNPSRSRLELLADLHDALQSGQFVLHYQPQMDLKTGQVYGVEALARWNHPHRGLLQPADFLPMVIETRLMMTLTEVVLRKALADQKQMASQGFRLRVSVNISALDLGGLELSDLIHDLLSNDEKSTGQLTLEVTEDSVIVDRSRSESLLNELRALGAKISLDDYGTGQASLSYLRDLPLDEIKLDRSFLIGTPSDTHNAAIVRSTIELAHTLGLPLIAEGVETADALAWLHRLGCDAAQGYFIGRPMPRADLENWLRRTPPHVFEVPTAPAVEVNS